MQIHFLIQEGLTFPQQAHICAYVSILSGSTDHRSSKDYNIGKR